MSISSSRGAPNPQDYLNEEEQPAGPLRYAGEMSFVALATCRNIPEPDTDEPVLLDALAAAGIPARLLAWDDDAVDWDAPGLTVIRSTWNYYLRPGAFLAWALQRGDKLVNAPAIVRWNHHKRYLADLEAWGIPVVPTLWVDRHGSVGESLAERGWTDIVVKPAISAGSHRTTRLSGPPFDDAVLADLFDAGDGMVQPYVASVDDYGERSLVYIDGVITHAIRKSPRFRNDDERVVPVPIADDERALALRALSHVAGTPLFARVDLVRDAGGQPMVGELELIEPSLFLTYSGEACARLVAAIGRRFAART
jgi:glutathione synthase/RimK-type ligase-like ATP-grasp enzyme